MESALSVTLKPSLHHQTISVFKQSTTKINASTKPQNNPITQTLKLTARTIVFSAAVSAAVISKFHHYPAIAQPITTQSETQETHIPEFLESNSESITAMKALLEQKLEAGEEDQETLKILKKLVSAQPENVNWKLLMARLLNEMGETEPAREALEQILTRNPLSFEALFENAVLIDSCGEGEPVVKRLETALEIAVEGNKEKEARDIRLIIAQVRFLQENVDVALTKYDELVSEDPDDCRAYFCKGMVYCLIDKNDEAKVQFAKYRELSPEKFEVEGYLGTSTLSRMKLFGTDDDQN